MNPRPNNLEERLLAKISRRLLPLLGLGYGIAYIDRVNLSFASLQMNQELHFSASVYGLGAGLFSLSYCLLEIPSNMLLARFGARRWISRIMLTWGLLAAGMLFVKTPLQFYVMRFLLGMAEAGFFPGVLYYLKHWYPATHSGRAISRFYIAVPLGAACMGAISGPLLALHGVAGLAGWQWLFLIEGLPAVFLSLLIFAALPDTLQSAAWLNEREREWLSARLSLDDATLDGVHKAPVSTALRDPMVWKLGLCNFLIMGSSYSFAFSAPLLLQGATHWQPTSIGLFSSATALVGALAMLFNGWHSDRRAERYLHVAAPLALMAGSLIAIGVSTSMPLILAAYVVYYANTYAVQAAFWPLVSNKLSTRAAAAGIAAIGSIGIFGGFVGPFSWGVARDFTGAYRAGLFAVSMAYGAAAAALWTMRRQDAGRS